MKVEAVVFDCDGIILESVEAKTEAFRAIALPWGREASERLVQYHTENGGVSRFVKFQWFFREILERSITEQESEALGHKYSQLCYENVCAAALVTGFLEVTDFLRQKKIPMYVASGTPDQELQTVIAAKKLTEYFKGIYGTPPAKTKLLENIVRENNYNPTRVFMVGDSSTDQVAALSVGTRFYGRGIKFKDKGYPWGEDLMEFYALIRAVSL